MAKWEEYDVSDLGRLMVAASDLEDEVQGLDFANQTDEEREALLDARYYAKKLYLILSRLAVKASREWKEAVAAEEVASA